MREIKSVNNVVKVPIAGMSFIVFKTFTWLFAHCFLYYILNLLSVYSTKILSNYNLNTYRLHDMSPLFPGHLHDNNHIQMFQELQMADNQ
jgi:hypothetical protein